MKSPVLDLANQLENHADYVHAKGQTWGSEVQITRGYATRMRRNLKLAAAIIREQQRVIDSRFQEPSR